MLSNCINFLGGPIMELLFQSGSTGQRPYKMSIFNRTFNFSRLGMAKKYCSWDIVDMERAIGPIRRGDMDLNQAAERY